MSNVSSPSSLWLDTSWRALSDKMHFPSQTTFLHSGWFLALAANAPNLWYQFYFRFYFCQQYCVLEFDFAPHSKQICRRSFPTLSPLGLPKAEGCLILSCLILCMTHHTTAGTMDWTSFPATCYHEFLCAYFHNSCIFGGLCCWFVVFFCFLSVLHAKGTAGKGIFSMSQRIVSILHNPSPFSVSLH